MTTAPFWIFHPTWAMPISLVRPFLFCMRTCDYKTTYIHRLHKYTDHCRISQLLWLFNDNRINACKILLNLCTKTGTRRQRIAHSTTTTSTRFHTCVRRPIFMYNTNIYCDELPYHTKTIILWIRWTNNVQWTAICDKVSSTVTSGINDDKCYTQTHSPGGATSRTRFVYSPTVLRL